MLRLTKFCLFSFVVAIIEITWSLFDLAEEVFVFFLGSESVGKFFVKVDRKDVIALTDEDDRQKLSKSEVFYWLLLLVVMVINFIWVIAAFKLLYGIIKVIFEDERLKSIKYSRLWLKLSWLLLIIFGVKIFRDADGWKAFFYALGVVIYRGGSMYIVYCFAKELEITELLQPNLDIMVGGVTRPRPPTQPGSTGFHINTAAGASLGPDINRFPARDVSAEVEVKSARHDQVPMTVFDTHPV